ncbi:DUF1657 domain-containing protein [Thalassobacillus pellis]|uniref:DUF1657 domain-containing protein n=1 Tax=Thalassobacillus pellis TaxID=748008 RepID=UPI0019614356|nr:DUF1657 domain-containing protein [Thalassobacillus pellis]MBM7552238.1 hypothetical protein [Thalassobacillus pellis]
MTIGAEVKQCLAMLKSMEAGLSTLALHSNDEETKRLFHEQMLVMEEIKQDIRERVSKLEREEEQYKGF